MKEKTRSSSLQVAQFTQITNQSENMAISYLQRVNWSVEHAVDAFFMVRHIDRHEHAQINTD